jgi:tRNA(Ile)-lysidine synthetase-like protein
MAAAALPPRLQVRARGGGERLAGAGGSLRAKELLRVQGVPAWLRAQVPFVYADGQLLAVGDAWLDARAIVVAAPATRPPGRANVKRAGVRSRRPAPLRRFRLIWCPPI